MDAVGSRCTLSLPGHSKLILPAALLLRGVRGGERVLSKKKVRGGREEVKCLGGRNNHRLHSPIVAETKIFFFETRNRA